MAGTYTIGEKKTRPGVYHRYENAGGLQTAGATNGIGAAVVRASWGPLNKVIEFEPATSVEAVFGTAGTTDLNTMREGYGIDQVRETMTVGELMNFLAQYDEDTPVFLSFDNGYTYGGITEQRFEEDYGTEEEEN